ncbi:MAG: elongation factor 1-beta [Thermoplasmataceae archaeon]
MGDVCVVFKVLPEDSELKIELLESRIVERIKGICEVNKVGVEDIGFGIKALKVQVVVPDEEGKIDRVEQAISAVPGVGQVDSEDVTLV